MKVKTLKNMIKEKQMKNNKKKLSQRERQVLIMAKEGLTNQHIADRIGLSIKTIENHMRAILFKLNARSRVDAVVKALKEGTIEL